MSVSVDTGAFSGCQHRSILERFRVPLSSILVGLFFCTSIVRYTGKFPVWQFRSLLGDFTYQITVLYYPYTDPHRHGFSERVPLKHDPTMLREFITCTIG